MERLRGLPAVLAMLLGGAAVALVAGAGLYAVRRRRSPEAEWADGVAALAEHEAVEEAARDLEARDATAVTPAAAARAPRAGPASPKPASSKPAKGGPGARGSTVIRGFQVLLAALVGVLIGFGVYLATGGTIVR
jgi:Flp pilus assembly protein TadB